MTPPARLLDSSALALISAMSAAISAVQSAAQGGRYVQVRRGNMADRVGVGLSPSDADAYDWWIDEYLSVSGPGYRATVEILPTPEEGDGCVWRYGIHEGPDRSQDFPVGWHRVSTLIGVS